MNKKLSYTKLQPVSTPRLTTKQTNQHRFWKKFHIELLHTSSAVPTVACADHNQADLILFAHGRQVMIVNSERKSIVRQIDHVADPVTALALRQDGKLMALGDEGGLIQVKDTKQKFNLRSFNNHKRRVTCLDFSVNDLYSGGEDMVIRLFDVAAGEVIHSYGGAHDDYIKCIRSLENNNLISGGYDEKIKLFDFRVHRQAQTIFDHGAQVEWLDVFPSKLNFVACGEKKITSWDLRYPKPLFENISCKKLVTSVRVASKGSRILSSSYDNYFKVYKSDSFQVTYQERMQSPILAFDITNSHCIGMALQNKKILLKSRKGEKGQESENQSEKEIEDEIGLWLKENETKGKFAYNDKHFYRGIYNKPQNFQIKFQRNHNKKISEYDKFLKKFQYKKALFTAIRKKNMLILIALIDEYTQRGCLDRVLVSLTSQQLEELLENLIVYLHDIRYEELAMKLLQKLTQISQQSDSIYWNRVKEQIHGELEVAREMQEISGMFDLLERNCL